MKIMSQLADWMLRTERMTPFEYDRVRNMILGEPYPGGVLRLRQGRILLAG